MKARGRNKEELGGLWLRLVRGAALHSGLWAAGNKPHPSLEDKPSQGGHLPQSPAALLCRGCRVSFKTLLGGSPSMYHIWDCEVGRVQG